jgi:hypothetical protein
MGICKMSNQKILEKAIKKAIDGGYKTGNEWLKILSNTNDEVFMLNQAYSLIFNHAFAKALWPTEASGSVDPRATSPSTAKPLIPTWQARLMEMVIADDPIKYLGENV